MSFLRLVTESERPEDNDFRCHRTWFFDGKIPTSDAWQARSERTIQAPQWGGAGEPNRPWLTQVVVNPMWSGERKAAWISESVRQFVDTATATLRACSVAPSHGRRRHLLALPVVGTGHGGGWREAGHIIDELVQSLTDAALRLDVDIALVTHTSDQLAAAQQARCKIAPIGGDEALAGLPPHLRDTAMRLARLSADGKLVLFLGAGVSMGAGLPHWKRLLSLLAEDAGMDAPSLAALRQLDLLDQARIIADRLEERYTCTGEGPPSLPNAVLSHVTADRFSLAHALLANLNATESVTTNYDTLFEDASTAAGHPTAVLPYESSKESGRWLLKMHGCVNHLEDIVLTREDFLRYADRRSALAGIVQALLITRHMLFVGFSLSDENFLRIADQVRKVVRLPDAGGRRVQGEPFGTALLIGSSPLLRDLWQGDITCLSLVPDVTDETALSEDERDLRRREGAAHLEILLDYVVAASNQRVAHVLNDRYDGLLNAAEIGLRDQLLRLRDGATAEMRQLPAWKPVAEMIRSLGGDPDVRLGDGAPGRRDYS